MLSHSRYGRTFYKCGEVQGGEPIPALDDPLDLVEWVNGFAAALAPHRFARSGRRHAGLDGPLLAHRSAVYEAARRKNP